MVMAPSAIVTHQEETINFDKVNFIDTHHGDHESDATGLSAKALVQKVLKEQIARIDTDTCEPGEEDAFYVADMGEVYRQHSRWKLNLARVKPFYGK
jgi:ornithine decarboxylase